MPRTLIEHDGAKVWIQPSAVLYLLGTQMDFEVTKMRSGFTFNNPNQHHRHAAAASPSN